MIWHTLRWVICGLYAVGMVWMAMMPRASLPLRADLFPYFDKLVHAACFAGFPLVLWWCLPRQQRDRAMLEAMDDAGNGDLIFANFVDFDSLFGHRRDVAGYAAALEAFDARLPELFARLRPGDLAVITADHGCDPTFAGTDHTRENVPILMFGPGIPPGAIGHRDSFADIGESVAAHLGLAPGRHGRSFL